MKIYEYCCESFLSTAEDASNEISDRANALGRHGWQLVTATVYTSAHDDRTVLTFKRKFVVPAITKSYMQETRDNNVLREGATC